MTIDRRDFVAGAAACMVGFASEPGQPVMSTRIDGYILDQSGQPAAGVSVSRTGRVVAVSRSNGAFSVPLSHAEDRVALTFNLDGHVPTTKVFNGKAPGTGNVVVIWPIAHRVTINPTRDVDLNFDGSRIQVPANAIASPGGSRAAGAAVLAFTLFDVTIPLQRIAASGDYTGRMLDRRVRRLNSYGIFNVQLHDDKGQPLSLRRGARAEIALAVPKQLVKIAPKTIGFFEIDLADGRWNEIGTFTFSPPTLTYNGSLTQFNTDHNCDGAGETVCIVLHVQTTANAPASNVNVYAHGVNSANAPAYTSQGTTNANGDVCLLVQRNYGFWAEASGMVGSSYVSSGVFSQQNFTSPNLVSGAADCGTSLCPHVGCLVVDYVTGVRLPTLVGRTALTPPPCAATIRNSSTR
jgi:hypothetical protein